MSAPHSSPAFTVRPDGIAVVPLDTHEARIAALVLCGMLGNDNKAVVMARGVSDDWENFTGLSIDDYELDELIDDPSWIDNYEDIQLWVTIPAGGAS